MSKTVPLSPQVERTTDPAQWRVEGGGAPAGDGRAAPSARRAVVSGQRVGVESTAKGWGRLVLAVLGGAAVGLSFQPYRLWPLLFVGVAALTLAVIGARPRRAFGLGFVFGLVMLVLAIGWIHVLGVPVAAC